ncbi:MAG: ATP-dependent helicase [Lachnospiraceae bacterium]|nr:ATP-dependent helicase [Lachnospiraceae bacterium]
MKKPGKTQKQAITHLSGPAEVIAGPGSGKTYTIIQRILYLIKQYHIKPDKILVITYTKAAATEMKERYEKACAADSLLSSHSPQAYSHIENVHFGTFHSICYNILRQCGFAHPDSLIKERDRRKLLQVILNNHGLSSKCTYENITNLLNAISRMKNLSENDLGGFMDNIDFSSDELMQMKEEYDQYLREQGMLDFDDMILQCSRFLVSHTDICKKYQELFEYILVDEFQDINLPQYQVLKLLAHPFNNLFVVGDDDQAIYGFRGATPGIMKRFMDDYQDGKQILLTENYRSGEKIVKLSGRMIDGNKERFSKEFFPTRTGGKISVLCFDTHREEEVALIAAISVLKPEQLPCTAVILRTNREVIQFGELLKSAGIAVKGKRISDMDFFHGFVMEDMIAFLSYLYEGNKRGDFIRFMNKPNRFLTRSAILSEVVNIECIEQYYRNNASMLSEIKTFFGQLHIAASLNPFLSLSFFRKTLGYNRYLREKAKDDREYQRLMRQADQIQNCIKDFSPGSSVRDFAERKAEQAGEAFPRTTEAQGVSVLTMHGAKGLEFDKVFLPDVNDGIIPGKDCITSEALEEERRLLYVAITRAKNELTIYYTKERGRKPSRFLEGIIPSP